MALSDNVIQAYHLDTSPGLLVDSGPNGLDLTNNNSVGSTTGKLAEGGDFLRGSSRYLSKTYAASMNVTSAMSVSMWLNASAFADYMGIVTCWDEDASFRSWGMTVFSDGSVTWYHGNDGGVWKALTAVSTLSTSTWYHLCGVVDNTDATHGSRVYVNGSLDNDRDPMTIVSGADFWIGGAKRFAGETPNAFSGVIDEVVVWNRAISGSEVTELYNSGAGLAYPFSGGGTTRGMPFGARSTAFNGGRTLAGVLR